jgi:hypothetical protein
MEATHSSKTSVLTRPTRRHVREYVISEKIFHVWNESNAGSIRESQVTAHVTLSGQTLILLWSGACSRPRSILVLMHSSVCTASPKGWLPTPSLRQVCWQEGVVLSVCLCSGHINCSVPTVIFVAKPWKWTQFLLQNVGNCLLDYDVYGSCASVASCC